MHSNESDLRAISLFAEIQKAEQGEAGNGGKIGSFDFHGLSSRRSCSLTLIWLRFCQQAK